MTLRTTWKDGLRTAARTLAVSSAPIEETLFPIWRAMILTMLQAGPGFTDEEGGAFSAMPDVDVLAIFTGTYSFDAFCGVARDAFEILARRHRG
ncbi:MAG: hypothetical protein ABIG71_02770 [Candidatus Uhrbacteria bacterium]